MAIPYVNITLDKEYKLRLGMRAIVEFERSTGLKIAELNDEDFKSFDTLSELLYRMIIKETDEDKKITLEKVWDLVDENADSVTEIISKVGEAISAAFPQKNAQTPKVK